MKLCDLCVFTHDMDEMKMHPHITHCSAAKCPIMQRERDTTCIYTLLYVYVYLSESESESESKSETALLPGRFAHTRNLT